jgi:hypothetical protein
VYCGGRVGARRRKRSSSQRTGEIEVVGRNGSVEESGENESRGRQRARWVEGETVIQNIMGGGRKERRGEREGV